jgi:mannose-6-phosphate isomerase-like protein (cupin superfamily)
MSNPTRERAAGAAIDDLPQLWDGFAKLVRTGMDISAFGVQIMDMPAGHVTKSHDESDSGQQELYVALRGSGAVVLDDRSLPLDPEHLVRIDAGVARVLEAGTTVENVTFLVERWIEDGYVSNPVSIEHKGRQRSFTASGRLFELADFKVLYASCNLEIIKTFGDYELSDFNPENSNRLILVAQKK